MKKVYSLIVILIAVIGLSMISFKKQDAFHQQVEQYLTQHLDEMMDITNQMLQDNAAGNFDKVEEGFFKARIPYKKIEPIVEYFYTESAVKLNGPNLLESEPSMPGEFKIPTGFQVLEEAVFADEKEQHVIRNEIENVQYYVKRVSKYGSDVSYTPTNLLDALKLNLFRLITKGMVGFDSPTILNSLPEAKETLRGTKDLLLILNKDHSSLYNLIDKAIGFLDNTKDFDTWDRATFVSEYINPVTASMVYYQRNAGIPFDTMVPKMIHPEALSLFDYGKWDIMFFAPSDALPLVNKNIKIGEDLFFDNRLSANMQRNCSSCHDPNKAFTDGLKVNTSLLGDKSILRNSPTLVNSGWQPAQFYDRRVVYLEDQIHDVVTNHEEMGQDFSIILERLNKDKELLKKVKNAIGKDQLIERDVKRFVAAYMRSLNSFNSGFDQYMQGNSQAMSASAVNGFNLFMGKAKCGTCHFMPIFNGTVPPNFEKIESEVLGVPKDKNNHVVDEDLGAYNVYQIGYQKYSFKTPSVRKSKETAPYMHNGIYSNLDEVIDFYNHGGGAGIGIYLEYQTLPTDSLLLNNQEKKDIKAFLEVL